MSDIEDAPCPRLSLEEKHKKYKPGSIRRVKLHNFLTYADVECFPGPRLNVVCGPNGTGKSTILCAICLGLGGQPPLLGRADDARTFIMHEKTIATIEIELAPFPGKPTHIIRRTIDRNKGATGKRSRGVAASIYEINDEVVRMEAIKTLVKETYRIQIANLCTFLPQDRVGSFSGFNSQQLLQETEKSVSGTQHLYDDHERLIQLEAELLSSESNMATVKAELDRLEEEVNRLEDAKKLMEEREESVQKYKLYQQKMLWVEFEELRTLAVEKKVEKNELKKSLKQAQEGLQPLQDEIQKLEREYAGGKQRRVALQRKIDSCLKQHHHGIGKAERHCDEIDGLQSELVAFEANQRRAEKLVAQKRQAVEDLKAILRDYPPAEEIDERCKLAQEELRAAKLKLREAKNAFMQIRSSMHEATQEYDTHKSRYHRMEDDKAVRNEKILSRDRNLQSILEWVDGNRKQFRRPVHGPIVCEVSARDGDVSNYLEQHVKNSVLNSFVVECREDMNLLYREVREKRKLRINIQMVDQGKLKPLNRLYSDRKMQTLQRDHDVRGYLDEFFDAPDAIMQALRNTSYVQGVLIGGERTKQNLDQGLQDYLFQKENGNGKQKFCIFAKEMIGRQRMYKYTSTISRYDSSKTSVSTDEVSPAKMLSPGVPPAEKERAQSALQASQAELDRLQPDLGAAQGAFDVAQREAQAKNVDWIDKKAGKSEFQRQKGSFELAKRKLEAAEKDSRKDNRKEKKKCIKNIRKHIESYISELEKASKAYKEYLVSKSVKTGVGMSEDGLLEKKRVAEEQLQQLLFHSRSLEQAYQSKSRHFDQARNAVMAKKTDAERLAPIGSTDDPTPLKAKLDDLPEGKVELEDLMDEAQRNISRILDNPAALRNYEEQNEKLDSQKESYKLLKGSKGAKRAELANLKAPYVASLKNIVARVNSLFTKYMSELGCAGEIAVFTGEQQRAGSNEEQLDNFKDWGIQIRVKFRAAANLQVLSAHVHSGGERSVSTIMYLMAMQDLMVSPFRCVDEINQGLDERNERLVFRRIVKNSTAKPKFENDPSSHSGQYFLITPKLLPNLTDMEQDDVTVMCIFNGLYNFDHFSDWNVDNLLKMRRKRVNDHGSDEASPEKLRRVEEKKED